MLRWLRRFLSLSVAGGAIEGSLTGTFDLREGVIAGWVDEIPYATHEGVTIDVVRHGKAIATCQTARDAHEGRLPFSLAIEGRFSPAELANEIVTVAAHSRRGDTGILKLDGATQIELVRKYLGVPAEPILELDFTSSGNAEPFLGDGWTAAGEEYTWTEDDDSFVRFPSPTAAGNYLLRLRAGAFISDMVPVQKVEIFINENLIAAFTADQRVSDFWEFRLDATPFTGAASAISVLRLHHPYAGRPSEHYEGNADPRRLGLSVRSLSLVRVLDA